MLDHFEKKYPPSYESFLETVHACINKAVVEAQRAAQYLFGADEDHITTFIVSNLRGQGIDADHDCDSGGHVDIFIQDTDKQYSWAAEAKIDTDWPWIEGGVGQLMDRYADGTVGRDQGGLLIYIKNENGATRIADWRARVIAKYSAKQGFVDADCPTRGAYAFFSECVFPKTGRPFRIRHVGVLLFREASKLAADAKRAAAAAKDSQIAASMKANDEAAVATADAASALAGLSGARTGDNELAAAAVLVNAAAKKSEQAAKIAKGQTVAKPAARRKRPGSA
ncbi:MAG: hypothetical protein KGO01_03510 [Burkholderiales bacterium]|nr:hypothetical protein [Burkholderiales bacterium]